MISEGTLDLVKRHGDHHTINIKYGYAIFLISILLYLIFHQFSRLIPLSTRWKNYTMLSLLLASFVIIQNYHSLTEFSVYAKRFARLSVALLPLNFYLAVKVPGSSYAVDYLGLVWLHKWVSRAIVLGSGLHGIGYVVLFLHRGEFTKVFRVLNFLGVIALLCFIGIAVISLSYFRRRIYKWFYSVHVILGYAVLMLLQFHARPGVSTFTVLNVSVIIYSIVVKFIHSFTLKPSQFQVIENPDSDLVVVNMKNYPFLDRSIAENGGHLRVSSLSPQNPLYYLSSSHPYTMIKCKTSTKLVVKKTNFHIPRDNSLTFFGPFASSVPTPVPNSSRLLFIAGGSGISFTLSLYQQYKSQPGVKIRFIWIVKDVKDLWILSEFGMDLKSSTNPIEIFVTGDRNAISEIGNLSTKAEESVGLMQGIELEEFQNAEDDSSSNSETKGSNNNKNMKFQKPFIPKLVSDFFRAGEQDENFYGSIVSCGPQSMNDECEAVIKREEYKGRIFCYNEVYEM